MFMNIIFCGGTGVVFTYGGVQVVVVLIGVKSIGGQTLEGQGGRRGFALNPLTP